MTFLHPWPWSVLPQESTMVFHGTSCWTLASRVQFFLQRCGEPLSLKGVAIVHFYSEAHKPQPLGVAARSSGPSVLWSLGPLLLRSLGPLVLVPWSSGPLVLWSSGPLVLCSLGPLVLWSLGPLVLVPWSLGPVVPWRFR